MKRSLHTSLFASFLAASLLLSGCGVVQQEPAATAGAGSAEAAAVAAIASRSGNPIGRGFDCAAGGASRQ